MTRRRRSVLVVLSGLVLAGSVLALVPGLFLSEKSFPLFRLVALGIVSLRISYVVLGRIMDGPTPKPGHYFTGRYVPQAIVSAGLVLSAVALLASLVLLFRGLGLVDTLSYGGIDTEASFTTGRGRLEFVVNPNPRVGVKRGFRWAKADDWWRPDVSSPMYIPAIYIGSETYWLIVHCQHWVLSILFAFPIVYWLLDSRLLRPRRYRNRGWCAACGYDLTGNESGVCPECGSAMAPLEGDAHGKV